MTDYFEMNHPGEISGDSLGDVHEQNYDLSEENTLLSPAFNGGLDHLHLRPHSQAIDSDNDGFSDAVEERLCTNPLDPLSHPVIRNHADDRSDSDHDGFSNSIEVMLGTDPLDGSAHPDLVVPRHYPAGSELNLPDTEDVVFNSWIASMP